MRKIIEEAHDGNDNLGSATYAAISIDFDRLNGCYLGGKIIVNLRQRIHGDSTVSTQERQQSRSINSHRLLVQLTAAWI
jgi:hypothetical protein